MFFKILPLNFTLKHISYLAIGNKCMEYIKKAC